MKQAAAVLAVLFLLFGVLRPTMRRLAGRDAEKKKIDASEEEQAKATATGGVVSYNYNQESVPVATPPYNSRQQLSADPYGRFIAD